MTALEQAQLVADRRHAHRQADRWIDRMDAAEYELTTPDVVLRWR